MMKGSLKTGLIGLSLVMLVASLACAAPFGIGFNPSAPANAVAQKETATPRPTDTLVPTPTNTLTPTPTPEPTPTATRVVLPTNTPTAVVGATGAAAELGGNPTEVAAAATLTATAEMATPTSPPPPPVAGPENVIVNGDFEADWPDWQPVAEGWTPFDNGDAHQGWYKETWSKVVFDGKQAQMIELINDQGVGDRYAGIFQTVPVVAGAEYELTIHGLIRSDEGSTGLSGGGYALQYGIDFNGGDDWQAVTNWTDLPFPEFPREDPNASNVYTYGTYSVKIRPTGKSLTLFIRAWKKWPDTNEGNFDVDGISLRGTGAAATATPTLAPATETPTIASTPAEPTATSIPPTETPTPLPEMPPSGGELLDSGPPPAVLVLAALVVGVLLTGAVVGIVRCNALR